MELNYRNAVPELGFLDDLWSCATHPARCVKNTLTDVGTGVGNVIGSVKGGIAGQTSQGGGGIQYIGGAGQGGAMPWLPIAGIGAIGVLAVVLALKS